MTSNSKSTIAKTLNGHHIETDMYFIDKNGDYQFDHEQLSAAKRWCKEQCEMYLKQGNSVVISNTFVKQSEMDVFRLLAKKFHASFSVLTCIGQCENNYHVSQATMQKLKSEWQP
ncbi:MAG: putative kinase [Alteromonadaceae bacterium]